MIENPSGITSKALKPSKDNILRGFLVFGGRFGGRFDKMWLCCPVILDGSLSDLQFFFISQNIDFIKLLAD